MAACLILLLCGAAKAQQPTNIGFISELTGAWSFFGTSCVAGMKLAEADIAASGGALGRPLKFLVVDDQTNPTQAIAASRSLDIQDQVLLLSGTTSSDVALAMYGYAEQNKVPFIAPVAAFPQLTRPGTRYTFRLEPDAVGWGYAISKFIEQLKPGAKVAVMYSDFALMRAIVAGLKYQAPRSGLTLTSEVLFPQGASDATVQAAQVRGSNPDFVVVVGAGGFDNTITNQLLDLGVKTNQIIHPYGITTQILGWGARSAGSYYGSFFDKGIENMPDTGKRFIERFQEANGRPPAYVENFCYVTPWVVKEALEHAGSVDREKFRDSLSSLKSKEPTSGIPIEFDKNGARKEYMYFMQIGSVDAAKKNYASKQIAYFEWDPEVIPVYDLVK
jgi:branched-chain amino acid transport system substrate-binding protein